MAEPKKRPANTDLDGPQKKPKFEKNAFRRVPGKNPFNKPGKESSNEFVTDMLLKVSTLLNPF